MKGVSRMVTDIFTSLTEIGEKFGGFLSGIFSSIGAVFYTPGTGSDPGSLTIVGIFSLIALVGGFALWALRWLMSLLKLK